MRAGARRSTTRSARAQAAAASPRSTPTRRGCSNPSPNRNSCQTHFFEKRVSDTIFLVLMLRRRLGRGRRQRPDIRDDVVEILVADVLVEVECHERQKLA